VFDWRDFRSLAVRLATDAQADEAMMRCAVSRGYYAAFHLALAHAKRTNRLQQNPLHLHDAVWKTFDGTQVERRIRQYGFRWKRRRRQADYDDVYPNLADDSARLADDIGRLIDDIDSLP
jgi:hypothetical protein